MGTVITLPNQEDDALSPEQKEVVDRYWITAELVHLYDAAGDRREKAFKQTRDRYKALEAEIAGWYATKPGDKNFFGKGDLHTVEISPRKMEREVTKKNVLRRILGAVLFNQLWEIPLGVIDKTVPKSEHKLFLVEGRTGKRRVDIVPERETAA